MIDHFVRLALSGLIKLLNSLLHINEVGLSQPKKPEIENIKGNSLHVYLKKQYETNSCLDILWQSN